MNKIYLSETVLVEKLNKISDWVRGRYLEYNMTFSTFAALSLIQISIAIIFMFMSMMWQIERGIKKEESGLWIPGARLAQLFLMNIIVFAFALGVSRVFILFPVLLSSLW